MSETTFSRVLRILQASGPEGIRTDVLSKMAKCKPVVLNNYLKRHRQAGVEIHTLMGSQAPATLFCRKEWMDAVVQARHDAARARTKARELKRSQERTEAREKRRAKEEAAAAAKRAALRPSQAAKAAPVKVPFSQIECDGPMPKPDVLPSQPVYSRHQITALPMGWQSPLNPAECRTWATMVGVP